MEVDITKFVEQFDDPEYDMCQFSDSIANSGRKDVGEFTWANAMEWMSKDENLLCRDEEALIEYFLEFGAWEREELEKDGLQGLNALLLQCIAGDLQTYLRALDTGQEEFDRYQECEGGHLYHHDDEHSGKRTWFYYVGM